MAKAFITYITITIALILLFNMVGLKTASGSALEQIGVWESDGGISGFQNSSFHNKFSAVLALAAIVVGISVGIFGRSNPEFAITAGVASAVGIIFIGDLISIMIFVGNAGGAYGWIGSIIKFLGPLLLVGFAFAVWDWVRRHD